MHTGCGSGGLCNSCEEFPGAHREFVLSFLTPPLQHFVANELEHTNGTDRYHFDATVPQQDLVDSYLPSFQACVEEGQVSSVMVRVLQRPPSCAPSCACPTTYTHAPHP